MAHTDESRVDKLCTLWYGNMQIPSYLTLVICNRYNCSLLKGLVSILLDKYDL